MSEQVEVEPCNEVVLVGRVSGEPTTRSLPSGDEITTFRVVVPRPPGRVVEGVRAPTIDTLDCVAWTGPVRRVARSLAAGDVVAAEGALRKRYWQGGAGLASRCEVEVVVLKRLQRAQASR